MATIKPIESRSIHQIQSGQVIVDLCSVVKELVENSLDAGATSIEVRFKNYGLDLIEVSDNGEGIAKEDYESIALKHYTSKLSSYDDLLSLETFGFRGEALSSLCALSKFHVVTARAEQAPKGTKLDFETSGKLKNSSVVASQKGTTVTVEGLFQNLPVRKRELEKNIKREYGKVLALLQAYACISTGVKFAVTNQPAKGKKTVAFSTQSNASTKDNISNVYGAKALTALIKMDLQLEMQSSLGSAPQSTLSATSIGRKAHLVHVSGHVSRPVVGEGRQTPDRQMFFVNSRPCGLPQIAKAFNEVYKSFNVSQSPFVFADLRMDTSAYDVNVSPDKRTIFLHDQTALLESLKASLLELFEGSDQSVPQSHISAPKLLGFMQNGLSRNTTADSGHTYTPLPGPSVGHAALSAATNRSILSTEMQATSESTRDRGTPANLVKEFAARNAEERIVPAVPKGNSAIKDLEPSRDKMKLARKFERIGQLPSKANTQSDSSQEETLGCELWKRNRVPNVVHDFNAILAHGRSHDINSVSSPADEEGEEEESIPSVVASPAKPPPGLVENAFDRMRPKRVPEETATITIGDKTYNTTFGNLPSKRRRLNISRPKGSITRTVATQALSRRIRGFVAPGTQVVNADDDSFLSRHKDELESETDLTDSGDDGDRMRESSDERDVDDGTAVTLAEPTNPDKPSFFVEQDDSDEDYLDEADKKAREEARVAKLIQQAEDEAARPTEDQVKRAEKILRGRAFKNSTLRLCCYIGTSIERIKEQVTRLQSSVQNRAQVKDHTPIQKEFIENEADEAEKHLSLTVSKSDFMQMRVVGQFNLGFVLVVRPSLVSRTSSEDTVAADQAGPNEELFIIDQHASDEKYNFERLQRTTTVQNQRLVKRRTLDLTILEEETILNNAEVFAKNGFVLSVDESGDSATGQRCQLICLPTSREVIFDTRDLEELVALLAENPNYSSGDGSALRPSKVRKLFAMRACRSSIMVGKSLTKGQMERLVRNMGEIDKPWNCPHGRPTMRHLFGLDNWTSWREGDGLVDDMEHGRKLGWRAFVESKGSRSPKEAVQQGTMDGEDDAENTFYERMNGAFDVVDE